MSINNDIKNIIQSFQKDLYDNQQKLDNLLNEYNSIIKPIQNKINEIKSNRDKLIKEYFKDLIGEMVVLPNGKTTKVIDFRISNKSGNVMIMINSMSNVLLKSGNLKYSSYIIEYPLSDLKFCKDILDEKISSIINRD